MTRLTGLGGSPGIAIGRAILLRLGTRDVRFRLTPDAVPSELERLRLAMARTREQLQSITARVVQAAGQERGYLFEAQLLMLDDPMLGGRAVELVQTERLNAEWAMYRACDELGSILGEADDAFLRERHGDIVDLVGRVNANLHRKGAEIARDLFHGIEGPYVLVADDLPPSVAAQLDWTRIVAFVTERGSRTHHTAILARSLGVPGVVGLRSGSEQIARGVMVVVDGTTGEVVVEPSDAVIQDAAARHDREAAAERALGDLRALPAVTRDGVQIRLTANIERPEELLRAREYGAEGIGLYRSEFLLAGGSGDAPGEDAQFEVYREMVERIAPEPVTVRTFGANQAYNGHAAGPRQLRGLRAVRTSQRARTRFVTQLRALLRAAAHGRLRIMFPLIGSLEEFREAKALLDEARIGLAGLGTTLPQVPAGVMIEVPSAALTADLLGSEVDFFSVGTNDLVHYSLAIDRTDDRLSNLYEPLHPAVLRLLRQVHRAARHHRKPLAICGEMASDPALLPLLVGLGITELSMTPAAIPLAKQVLRKLDARAARAVASGALGCTTVREIEQLLTDYANGRADTGAAVNE